MGIAESFGSGVNAIGGIYRNQMMRDQLQTYPDLLNAQLQITQAQGKYADPMAAATLKNQQNINQYYPQSQQAAINLTNAQVPNVEAQTALTNATIPLLPLKANAAYISANANLAKAGISNANSFRAFSQTPQGQQLIINNPEAAQTFINAMNNSSNLINSGTGFGNLGGLPGLGGISTNPLQAPSPQQDPQGLAGAPSQVMAAGQSFSTPTTSFTPTPQSGGLAGVPNPSNQLPINVQQIQKLRQLFGGPQTGVPTPDQKVIQNATQDAYTMKNTPKPIIQQRYYDQSTQNMLDKVAPDMPAITQFASLAGQSGAKASEYAQAAGLQTSPQYQKYRNFVDVQMPIIANEIKRSLGGQATDSETHLMQSIADPVSWDKNPTQALSDYNTLVSTLKSNEKAISQSPGQAQAAVQAGATKPSFVLPSFKSAADAKTWFNSQPADVQLEARQIIADQQKK